MLMVLLLVSLVSWSSGPQHFLDPRLIPRKKKFSMDPLCCTCPVCCSPEWTGLCIQGSLQTRSILGMRCTCAVCSRPEWLGCTCLVYSGPTGLFPTFQEQYNCANGTLTAFCSRGRHRSLLKVREQTFLYLGSVDCALTIWAGLQLQWHWNVG